MNSFPLPPDTQRLPDPYREEIGVVRALAQTLEGRFD